MRAFLERERESSNFREGAGPHRLAFHTTTLCVVFVKDPNRLAPLCAMFSAGIARTPSSVLAPPPPPTLPLGFLREVVFDE